MPIYEYQCKACGHEAEVFQRMSDPDETACPACKAEAFTRLISAAGFRLKGAGWYETDFKSGNKRNVVDGKGDDKAADKSEAKPADKTSGAKSDAVASKPEKPAAKAEPKAKSSDA